MKIMGRNIPGEIIVGLILAITVLIVGLYNTINQGLATQTHPNTINKSTGGKCIIYGESTCPACLSLKKFFDEHHIPYVFRDIIYSKKYSDDFYFIVSHAKLGPYVPTTLVLDENNNVTAIVQGVVTDLGFWEKLLRQKYSGNITVYSSEGVWTIGAEESKEIYRVAVESSRSAMGSSTTGTTGSNASSEIVFGLMTSLFFLALIDSINPCAISTAMIVSANAVAIGFTGKKKYLPVLLFATGVYAGYFIVGYFVSILALHNIFLSIVIAIAIMLIARDIHELRAGKISSEVSCGEKSCLPGFFSKTPSWLYPLLIIVFGVVVSWSFMLCSATPYILFVTLLSRTIMNEFAKIIFIAVYCSIIIVPIILAGVATQFISNTLLNIKKIVVLRVIVLLIIVLVALGYLV